MANFTLLTVLTFNSVIKKKKGEKSIHRLRVHIERNIYYAHVCCDNQGTLMKSLCPLYLVTIDYLDLLHTTVDLH